VADNLEARPWRFGDLQLLRASEFLFFPETYPRRFLPGDRLLRPLHLRVAAQLSAPERRWTGQVALDGNRLVALAECAWEPADPYSPTLAVNLAQAWQGSGLDRTVLRQLVSRCMSLGLTTFNLDYAASNTALQSFGRLGAG
jgi:hypothetical protein